MTNKSQITMIKKPNKLLNICCLGFVFSDIEYYLLFEICNLFMKEI